MKARDGFLAAVVAAIAALALLLAFRTGGRIAAQQLQTEPTVWPMYQRVASHNAVVERHGFRANWQRGLGDRINGGFAVIGSVIFADSFDQKLYAIDAPSGNILWSAPTDDILMSTPVAAQNTVIAGTGHNGFLKPTDASSQTWGRPQGNDVFAFSAGDGHLLWKFHTAGENMPSPAISGNNVIFANGDAHAYALDLKSGKARWHVALPGAATMASATIAGGAVFVSSCHNAPYYCETRAIDIASGKTLWRNPNGGNDCSPAVSGGSVFVNSNLDDTAHFHTGGTDIVAALDQRSGKTLWTYKAEPGPYTFPASNERQIAGTVADNVLYQPIGNASRVVALDARTGKPVWNIRTWASVKMSPVVYRGLVYFGDTGGVLYKVDQRSGRILHTSSFLQPFSTAPPVIIGDTLVIADGSIIVAMPLTSV